MKKMFFLSLLVLLTVLGIAPTVQAQSTPQYGEELLTNIPPATTDFTGWTTSSSNSKCIPQCSEGWFKTSYAEGTISQTIDLAAKGYTPIAANTLFLYAATEYKVGSAIGKQDGSAKMYVECLDAEGNILATNTVLNRTGIFGIVETTLVQDMFTIPANTTQLRYVLKGMDQCNWIGYYGPWFRNMSCQVWDSAKFNETIKVSVAPALGDSITLSKTSDFHFGDTITVSATHPEYPILWLSTNEGVIINTNQVVCWGDSIVVNAHLKYDHAITCNGTHATIEANSAQAGMGDTVTLSCALDENCVFVTYTTNIDVKWIDANRFIMPDEAVIVGNTALALKPIPYFEGFEEGNTDQQNVVGWLQQSESGDRSWVANSTKTDYNRTPYAGKWNTYLYGSNTDWLFQAFTLEVGKEYAFSMWARSNNSSNILVQLGNQANKNAMSVTVVPTTTLSTKDYQYLSGKITVETTGTYVIGIRGYSDYSSNAISIDSIMVREAQAHAITLNGTHATLKADKATASVGDTVTLSYALDENCVWVNYTTDINVRWIDANRFIMPDEAVSVGNSAIAPKPIPYFEGFEEGNTGQENVAGWLQQSEKGDPSWLANSTKTDYNCTPYAGSWNATLRYSNTDWLFQLLALEADENYALSLYARQDKDDTSYANITAALGDVCNKDAMTTTILPAKGLTNGDYQLLTDTFQVTETKVYVLGIKGYINSSPYYISMDNILVSQEVYPVSIATPVGVDGFTEDAARAALATLSLNAQDRKGNTKCTITNLAENWVLDLENKKATYTVANSLLPMGYFFAEPTATITVDLVLNQYTFTINEAVNGSVTGTTSGTYDYGKVVTLIATPAEHYHFVQWSNGATAATCTFTLTGDTILTAIFEGDPRTITVAADENGSVKVAVDGKDTTATTFAYGTEVTLTAIPDEGYYFVEWSDGSRTTPYVFTLKQNCELTAHFAQIQYGEELLTNIPPAATNFTDWTTTTDVECSEGWFKTGRFNDTISQTIDLAAKGYTPVVANTLLLYAAAEYFVGWAKLYSGSAKVYVDFLDAEGNILSTNYVLNREGKFGTVDITLVEDMFTIPANTTQVRYVLQGKDQCSWGGAFGPWFRNMSCKVFDNKKVGASINVSVAETLGDSLTLSKTSDFRYGDTITVTPTYPQHPVIGLDVNEGRIINGNQVVCLGENIVISAELMSHKSVPYFEGFENGNKQDYKVAGWLLQYEEGNCNWSANNTGTSDNRSPYDGSWNATLSKGNTNWLFQALSLEADETYALSLYARQTYSTTANATITAVLGTAFDKEAMSDTLIVETGVNSVYQQLTDTFHVLESKVYVLGIRGCINMNSWALAMDNILVSQEVYPVSIATPVGVDGFTEDAARTALATLSLTAQDRKGNTKCTITNLAENWVLDLENKKATYTAADSLLPVGYYCTDTITVDLVLNQYTLTIGEAVNGSVSGTTSGTYDYGKVVTLIATPAEHYHFVQWSNGATAATYTFTLTGDTTLTAEFAINQHTVTIGEAENGSVKVAVNGKDTTATTFDYGTVLTLTPMANVSYSFEKWDDGNTDNPRVITLTENISITAIFKKDAATQLTETNVETKVQKVMRNGQVFIIRNGNTYDLTGRKTE